MAKVIASLLEKTGATGHSDDPITTDGLGNLNVNVAAGGASGGTSSTFSAAFPATGTAAGASDGSNMQPLLVDGSGFLKVNVSAGSAGGVSVVDAAAVTAGVSVFVPTGGVFNDSFTALVSGHQGFARLTAQRAFHTNIRDNSGNEVGILAAPLRVDPVGTTTQPISGTVQPGNTPNTSPWLITQVPATTGGLSISRTLSVNNTTGTNPKGSAGQVFGGIITNVNAAVRFVKLYNKATAPVVASDTPVITLQIPGNTAGAGMVFGFTSGLAFSTGIGLVISTGVGDTDSGAPAANEVIVNLFYK